MKRKAKIYYVAMDDFWRKEQKLAWLRHGRYRSGSDKIAVAGSFTSTDSAETPLDQRSSIFQAEAQSVVVVISSAFRTTLHISF